METKDLINSAFFALCSRLKAHYAEEAKKNQAEQENLHAETLSVSSMIQNGMSPAAICAPERVQYMPKPVFPDALRLGVIGRPHTPANLRFMHPCASHKALVLHEFEPEAAHIYLQNACLRLLGSLPVNMLKLHLVDPMGLGKAFSVLSELDAMIKGQKVLTEEAEINRLMYEIKATAVSLVQQRLANRYETLRDYNEAAGEALAEPYHVVCIAGYPAAFSRNAAETLDSLINTCEKSGVMVLLSTDEKALQNYGDKTNLRIFNNAEHVFIVTPSGIQQPSDALKPLDNFSIRLDAAPIPNAMNIIVAANEACKLYSSQTVALDQVFAQPPYQMSSQSQLSIPLGIVGKDETCLLELGGKQTQHHVLVSGDTGSGKSVLLHNIIVNGAWNYSPDELEFYLLDYKEGTEFAVYKSLPHARVLSMESSREFGICTLEYLLKEMEARGVEFKKNNVANLAAYRGAAGAPLSRILIIIDEFQHMLSGSDALSKNAARMLEDIARRGRAFGIHLVLSTQTLAEVNIGQGTLDNIGVRIAFRMSEANCARVMHRDNLAPSTLKKTGEAYYNDGKGQSENNKRFQTAFLDREKTIPGLLERLSGIGKQLKSRHIFDGQRYLPFQNSRLLARITQGSETNPRHADLFLAEPGYISEELFALRLRRQAASNVLMVGDALEDAVSLCGLMLFQLQRAGYGFAVLDFQAPDSPWHGRLRALLKDPGDAHPPRQMEQVLDAVLQRISERLQTEAAKADPPFVLIIMNAQSGRAFGSGGNNFSSPAAKKLEEILKQGPEVGVHCVVHYASHASFSKILGKGILTEFENQILLRGGDSYNLRSMQLSAPITASGSAYIIAPNARYGADPVRVYDPEGVFNILGELKQ